jgi:DNA gyrase subunit A
VKKTRLADYNSPRQAGVIAINFREEDDELIGAELVGDEDHVLLVSRNGQAIRFHSSDMRPMGRATSGVTGMKFRDGDELLSMSVIRAAQVQAEHDAGLDQEEGADGGSPATTAETAETAQATDGAVPGPYFGVQPQYVFTITDRGFAKRTRITEYRLQSRGGIGIKAMKQDDERGRLVGAFIVVEGDEVLAIKQSGQVTRSAIDENLRPTGRDTKGVKFVGVSDGDSVAEVARCVERAPEIEEAAEAAAEETGSARGADDPADATIDPGNNEAADADAPAVDEETEES